MGKLALQGDNCFHAWKAEALKEGNGSWRLFSSCSWFSQAFCLKTGGESWKFGAPRSARGRLLLCSRLIWVFVHRCHKEGKTNLKGGLGIFQQQWERDGGVVWLCPPPPSSLVSVAPSGSRGRGGFPASLGRRWGSEGKTPPPPPIVVFPTEPVCSPSPQGRRRNMTRNSKVPFTTGKGSPPPSPNPPGGGRWPCSRPPLSSSRPQGLHRCGLLHPAGPRHRGLRRGGHRGYVWSRGGRGGSEGLRAPRMKRR